MTIMTTITRLDVVQVATCIAIAVIAIYRLDRLHFGQHGHGAIVAMLSVLAGAVSLPLLHLFADEHATVGSVVFSGCVLAAAIAGTRRWRSEAPPEAGKHALHH